MKAEDQTQTQKSSTDPDISLESFKLSNQLKIEQYKSLRTEIQEFVKNIISLEIFAVGGMVALCVDNDALHSVRGSLDYSNCVADIRAWRVLKYNRQILEAAEFIRDVEDKCAEMGTPWPQKGMGALHR